MVITHAFFCYLVTLLGKECYLWSGLNFANLVRLPSFGSMSEVGHSEFHYLNLGIGDQGKHEE